MSGTDAQPETPQVDAPEPMPHVPSSWPGAFHLFRYSAQAVKRNIWLLVEIWVVYYAFYFLANIIKLNLYATLLISLVIILLAVAVSVITTGIFIAGARGKHLTASEAFSGPLPMLTVKMIGLNIITSIALMVSLLALIIPFFFVYPRLALASYFLIDKNMGPLEAFKASWRATKGNTGKIWGILGVNFLMGLLMITIIGIPFAIYFLIMYSGAYAVLYEMIGHRTVTVPADTVSAAPIAD